MMVLLDFLGILEPIDLAVGFDDVEEEGDSVKQRDGKAFTFEYLGL